LIEQSRKRLNWLMKTIKECSEIAKFKKRVTLADMDNAADSVLNEMIHGEK
jgi:hypothetical protein